MSRAETAKEYFLNGYTCAQAVLLAFSDLTGLDGGTAKKISLPFGGGTGRLRLTCGAFNGAVMALGMLLSEENPNAENKREVYACTRELAARFKEKNGSLNCDALLTKASCPVAIGGEAEARTAEYYKKRPCPNLVHSAAEILEEFLREKGITE